MPGTIQEVKARHEERLLSLPGVVSVGIGRGRDGQEEIVVGLDRPRKWTALRIPGFLDGYRVRTDVRGRMRAL
ncbi:MAG: hypothetical protein LUO86_04395 [Methanomicrobiales archaeon]|nr:hypothetical protein [Methanomicrobiales archaeon]